MWKHGYITIWLFHVHGAKRGVQVTYRLQAGQNLLFGLGILFRVVNGRWNHSSHWSHTTSSLHSGCPPCLEDPHSCLTTCIMISRIRTYVSCVKWSQTSSTCSWPSSSWVGRNDGWFWWTSDSLRILLPSTAYWADSSLTSHVRRHQSRSFLCRAAKVDGVLQRHICAHLSSRLCPGLFVWLSLRSSSSRNACANPVCLGGAWEQPPRGAPGYQVLSDILFRLGLIVNCSHTVWYLDCSDLNWRCNHYHLFWHCMTYLVLMCR